MLRRVSLVETGRRFWDAMALLKAVSASETSVSFYQTTRRNIPADTSFQDKTHSYNCGYEIKYTLREMCRVISCRCVKADGAANDLKVAGSLHPQTSFCWQAPFPIKYAPRKMPSS
jgi:hypothetical protein